MNDFILTPAQQASFDALDALYREWNAKINVISRKDIDHVFDHILPPYVDYLASKRKQRPPSIRRLYRRRYIRTHFCDFLIRTIRSIRVQNNLWSICYPGIVTPLT